MLKPPKRMVRHIQPVGPRVLVRILKNDDMHESGLYLPAGAKDNLAEALYAEVVEVARAAPDDDDELGSNVSGVPLGSFVLFDKDEGTAVPWDETLRLLPVKAVLATVEEVPIEETH